MWSGVSLICANILNNVVFAVPTVLKILKVKHYCFPHIKDRNCVAKLFIYFVVLKVLSCLLVR